MQGLKFSFLLFALLFPLDRNLNEKTSTHKFKAFLKKFQPISLPLRVNTSCYSPDTSTSVRLDPKTDSLFLEPNEGMASSIGILPDTSHCYVVIYCVAANCWMPKLAVYSKKGIPLSREQIAFACGADCGYECSDSLVVNSINDITQTYVQEFYTCGSLKEKDKNRKKSVKIFNYSVDQNGMINMTSKFTKVP